MRIHPTGVPDLDPSDFARIAGAAVGVATVATTDRDRRYAEGIEDIACHYAGHPASPRLSAAFGYDLSPDVPHDVVALRAFLVADDARTDADLAYATAVGDMSRWLFGSGMGPDLAPFLDAAETADSDQ